jgi:TP901 family phage tail tape measure protein
MTALKVPTIFSVIDKVSGVMRTMKGSVQSFANTLEIGAARGERWFRKLTPTLSEAAKQFLSFASSAAIAGAIIAGISFSITSIKNYESALQSFRTIVSDLTDKEFSAYQNKINQVAKDTKKSSIDVAQSFEKIAGLNAEFAKTSEGIGAVSKASITLSKASGAELGQSAENLVGIMNQFSLAATEADRTINVLAAGQAVGAANINQTAEAFVNFGSVAAGANITLEESVGLIQTLGKFSIFGAEAGTKLRGSLLRLQKSGVGYASGQFSINDALAEAKSKLDKLHTAKQKDAYLNKLFGAENIATGRTLLSNIDLYKKFTEGVTGTNEAQKAAVINSNTLNVKLDEMKNRWINIITSSDKATSALSTAKNVIGFLTDNMETIISVGSKVLLFFAAWKILLIATRIALIGYNVVLGITGALSGTASVAIGANAIALGAYKTALAIATAAQWALNVALTANPIGLVIVAIAALIGIVTLVISKWNEWGGAVSLFLGPLGFVVSLIQSFRRNWDMVKESFKSGGILGGLKAIGKVILDAVLMPIQQVASIIADLTGAQWAKNAVKAIAFTRNSLGVNTKEDESGKRFDEAESVNDGSVDWGSKYPLINPDAARQDSMRELYRESTNHARVQIDVNDPRKMLTPKTDSEFVKINTSSTVPGAFQPGF